MSAALRRPGLAGWLFAAGVVGSGVLLLTWLSDTTFLRDEWSFLLHRRGSSPDVFLEPNYEHIAISLVAAYKALVGLFGMDSALPFQVMATVTFLASVVLMFIYVRRRVGPWLALAAALPILVLGAASDDLLWPFQTGFFGSMTAGLGALLALERRDRAGDVLACVLLVVSISFSSLGLPFALGIAVDVAWGADRARRAYVVALPLAFYAIWWLGWGHEADSHASFDTLATLPSYVLDGLGAGIASWLGISVDDPAVESGDTWARVLLVVAVALAIWRLRRVRTVSRPLAVVGAIALSFWALAGLNAWFFRDPFNGRYQYMGAIFFVLVAAELLRGVRLRALATAAVLAVAAVAAIANLSTLHDAWAGIFANLGRYQRADLAALELSRDSVDPSFELTQENSGVDYLGLMDAGSYFSAVDAYGSPAYSPDELAAAPENARAAADQVFAAALGVALAPNAPRGAPGACMPVTLGAQPSVVELEQGGALLRPDAGTSAGLRLRRYADESFPIDAGTLHGAREQWLRIPTDRSQEPWELALSGHGRIDVCAPGTA